MISESEFYHRLWGNRGRRLNAHEVHRLSRIFDAIAGVIEARGLADAGWDILELGCGVGWLTHELAKFGRAKGVDLSTTGIEEARRRWPSTEFEVGDVTSYSPGKLFDLVISSEVIEHVERQEGLVRSAWNCLHPGGYFLITCPNAKVQKFHTGGRQPREDWLTPRRLRELLLSVGFNVVRHETFYMHFSRSGRFRFVNSYKVRSITQKIGQAHLYDSIWASLGWGLYQLALCRKH